jgi:hypothetical protein
MDSIGEIVLFIIIVLFVIIAGWGGLMLLFWVLTFLISLASSLLPVNWWLMFFALGCLYTLHINIKNHLKEDEES